MLVNSGTKSKHTKTEIRVVKGESKVSQKGWVQYVEITTLPNGKKVSVTKHGPKPE